MTNIESEQFFSENISHVVSVWDKLRAFQEATGYSEDMFYQLKDLKRVIRLGSPVDLVTVTCVPQIQMVTAEGLHTKKILPPSEVGEYDILPRAEGLKWLLGSLPRGSRLRVVLADDDWVYTYKESFDPSLIAGHKQAVSTALGGVLGKGRVVVDSVAELVPQTGIDYVSLQNSIIGRVMEVKGNYQKLFPQQPAWLKHVLATTQARVNRRLAQLGKIDIDDVFIKAAKLQTGICIQGLALRAIYSNGTGIYAGTYKELEDFGAEVRMMMEVQDPKLGYEINAKKLPAIYCPAGKLQLADLENLSQAFALEGVQSGKPKVQTEIETSDVTGLIEAKRRARGGFFRDKFSAPACDD